jgi:hypothetical protein
MLDGFQVNIGKISFKDMTGQEIEDQLNAIFSSIGDQMAGALPSLATMQKVGEGLFETFIRVAKEYETVDVELKSIGKTFGAVGVGSIAARDALVQLFGGLDDFVSATDFFRDKFLTDAEQIAPVQASVIAEMQRSASPASPPATSSSAGARPRPDHRRRAADVRLAARGRAGVRQGAELLRPDQQDGDPALQSTVDQFTKFADSLQKYRDTLFADRCGAGQRLRHAQGQVSRRRRWRRPAMQRRWAGLRARARTS